MLGDGNEPPGTRFRTSDLDEAREIISRAYAPHELSTRGPKPSLNLRVWLTEFERLNIGYTAFGTDVRVVAPPTLSYYVVCLPIAGHTRALCGGDSALLSTAYGAVLHPTEPAGFEDWCPDCTLLGVRIDRADLDDELAAMLGRPLDGPIRFDFGMDLRTGHGGAFLRALQMMEVEAERPDGMAHTPALAAKLTQVVISGLLVAQPHNYSDALRTLDKPAPPDSIRRVIELIETSPEDILSAVDLARAACLSVRAVGEGFKRHVGMTPMTYLREVRLSRARADLLGANPRDTTVAAIANRWGFNHLGRFTEVYRRKYGVLPSVTLREHRRYSA
jgi:AraC-like DNA-binding protein